MARVEVLPIAQGATPDQNNLNKHTQKGGGLLENSLRKRGAFRSIASAGKDVETPVVYAGNYTLEKAIDAGFTEVVNVHVTGNQLVNVVRDDIAPGSAEAIALGIEDNEVGKQSYNPDIDLLAQLAAADGGILAETRKQDKMFNDLLQGMGLKSNAVDVEPQIDRAAELLEKWQVVTGDMFAIGEHRLLCGDSTKREDVERVMGGEKAQICWTDPPWNVAYGEGFRGGESALGWKKRTIINDNLGDKFPEFVEGFVTEIEYALCAGGILYMAMSSQEWGLIMQVLEAHDFHWSSTIIWAKDSLVVSRKDYHTQYEPLWYGWKSDAARVCEVVDRKESDLWHINRPKSSPEHPTMKPVELVQRSLVNSSKPAAVVYEPFAGSGTTLVACQNLGRKCRAIEISPAYCAVILERMSTAFPALDVVRI